VNKKKNPPLNELVDLDELQTIQDSFAETVGTSSIIFSPEGEPLTEFSNPTGFCSMIQSTDAGKRCCFQSFQKMVEGVLESKEPRIMYCFAHGGHFVAPIVIGGEHRGTMFAGQFIPSEFSEAQLDDIRQIAMEIDMDLELLLAEAKQMRVVREDVVRNYSSLLFQIVRVIAKLGSQAGELRQTKDTLQKAYGKLEDRVRERTSELAKANAGLQQEIAERKSAEDALRVGTERFRIMFENMSNAVAVYESVDEGGDFICKDLNCAGEKIDDVKRDDLIGKSVLDVFSGVVEFGLFDVFQRVWRTGKPEHHPISFYRGKKTAGWRENYVYKLPSGEIVAIYDDVTERKNLERELQQAFDKLKASYEELSIPVIQVWDGVLVLPIIGVLDNERINRLMETMLAKIVETHSRVGIIDVTGVRSVDANVANDLINVTKAAKLLGTKCVLTGITPGTAHTLVGLGVDISEIVTKRSMQEGLKHALQIAGVQGS